MNAALKGKLIAGFILAFLAGGVTGSFFTFHEGGTWRRHFGHHSRDFTGRMQERIESQLNLTPEQKAKIQPVFDQAAKELEQIRAETGAKVRRVFQQTHQALEPILTTEQQSRLKQIEQRTHHEDGPGRHPRHRGLRRAPAEPEES